MATAYESKRMPGHASGSGDAVKDAMNAVNEAGQGAVKTMQEVADTVTQQGRQAADGIRDVASTFADAVEESLEKRPIATLGMAVAAGFLLGALWQR